MTIAIVSGFVLAMMFVGLAGIMACLVCGIKLIYVARGGLVMAMIGIAFPIDATLYGYPVNGQVLFIASGYFIGMMVCALTIGVRFYEIRAKRLA